MILLWCTRANLVQAQREAAAQKIRDDHDRKIYQWIGWAETFEARAGPGWKPADENEHRMSSPASST